MGVNFKDNAGNPAVPPSQPAPSSLPPAGGMPQMAPVNVPTAAVMGNQYMLGEQFIASVIRDGKLGALMGGNVSRDLFYGFEVQLFDSLMSHAKKHGKIPASEVFLQGVELQQLPDTTEPPSYYLDKLRDRFIGDSVKDMLLEAKNLITDIKDPMAALKMVQAKAMTMCTATASRAIIDLRDAENMLMSAYAQQLTTPEDAAILTGWETPDSFTGGSRGGDVISLVGRPQDGKSWLTFYSAINAWKVQKKRVLVVSMEMLPLICAQRISSLYTATPFKYLMKAELATPNLNKYKNGLVEMKNEDAPFWVLDGNLTATVEDIWNYAIMLKPDAIYIDGAYLVGNSNKRLDRFARVAENARLFKGEIATNLEIPLWTTWQFNREAAKKMKQKKGDNKADLEDIGFSDEIGQISSLVLGVTKNADVASLMRKRIDILKGRNGETGHFDVFWNFRGMDFKEYVEDPTDLVMDSI